MYRVVQRNITLDVVLCVVDCRPGGRARISGTNSAHCSNFETVYNLPTCFGAITTNTHARTDNNVRECASDKLFYYERERRGRGVLYGMVYVVHFIPCNFIDDLVVISFVVVAGLFGSSLFGKSWPWLHRK